MSNLIKAVPPCPATPPKKPNFQDAAQEWYQFGYSIIPIAPGSKMTVTTWDSWLADLSSNTINNHWSTNPNHELGFIVGSEVIVFDADTPEALAAIYGLEKYFDINCNLIIKTNKGEHHHFRLSPGAYAKSDSHSTDKHPDRIDIKTRRAMVVLPPSTEKSIIIDEAENKNELTEVGQDFIDAIFRHNGRNAPREDIHIVQSDNPAPILGEWADTVKPLLEHIDPDCGYDDWRNALMAIHHESNGSDEGMELACQWSSSGSKFKGRKEVEEKWQSFNGFSGKPITSLTLRKMALDGGADITSLPGNMADFAPTETEVITPNSLLVHRSNHIEAGQHKSSIWDLSLNGQSAEFEKRMLEDKFILSGIALLGQWTVIYARHNTGKTLITLHLLIKAIVSGDIDPSKVVFVNADDSHSGLTEKLKLAEQYDFKMIAPGHKGFNANKLPELLKELVKNGEANGTVIILDTLKKFVDHMSKTSARAFGLTLREFVSNGGSIIALSHVNKNPGANGKAVYSGTSDIIDDADCAFILDEVSVDANTKTVEFENQKNRGKVASRAAYSYSVSDGINYADLLESVIAVDDTVTDERKYQSGIDLDSELINTIEACIRGGAVKKMEIVKGVAASSGASRQKVQNILEKYSGSDPKRHKWDYTRKERGAMHYHLLEPFILLEDRETENLEI